MNAPGVWGGGATVHIPFGHWGPGVYQIGSGGRGHVTGPLSSVTQARWSRTLDVRSPFG